MVISWKLRAVAVAGLTRIKYSPGGRSPNRRAASLSRRRKRLRTTALPTLFPMAKTKAGGFAEASGSHDTVSGPDRADLARRRPSMADRFIVHHVKLPGGAGPSGGARSVQPAPIWSPSGDGTRAAWLGGAYEVGKGVSTRCLLGKDFVRGKPGAADRVCPPGGHQVAHFAGDGHMVASAEQPTAFSHSVGDPV